MQRLVIRPPVIQLAIDLFTIDEALKLAEIGVKAGVDWLEAGTPLIVKRGVDAIGAIARAFPDHPVLADYKTMDGGGRNVNNTAEQGGRIMTVCRRRMRGDHHRRRQGIGQDRRARDRRYHRRAGSGRRRPADRAARC